MSLCESAEILCRENLRGQGFCNLVAFNRRLGVVDKVGNIYVQLFEGDVDFLDVYKCTVDSRNEKNILLLVQYI